MKIIFFYLLAALLITNITLGYNSNETSQFIDDLKLGITPNKKDFGIDELKRINRAVFYLKGTIDARGYALLHTAASLDKNWSQWTGDKHNKLEEEIYGYTLPKNANMAVFAKVIIRHSEINPGSLTKNPIIFIDQAFQSAWGSN